MIKVPRPKQEPMPMPPIEPKQNDMGNDKGFGDDMDDEIGLDDGFGDKEFDAGVDADKETDPKKYIQQLSGKLSQELRSYNQEGGTPDVDLNKYVAGMVIPQATKAMTDSDKNEVIKKINNNNTSASEDEGVPSDGYDDDMGMKMESSISLDNIIREIVGVNDENDERHREEKKIGNKMVNNKNPFVSKF